MMQINSKGLRKQTLGDGEQGFMLLGLIVAIAIILIGLGVAASKVAFSLRREREVESARRADQYVRAIRKFYLKNQHYPGSLEQLENTNNIRYLRQQYVDPLTGKDDYRLILVGQNKTQVKGFFGEPLAGIASAGLGAAAGMQSSGVPGQAAGRELRVLRRAARRAAVRRERLRVRPARRGQAVRPGRVVRAGQAGRGRRVRRSQTGRLARRDRECQGRWDRLWVWAAARRAVRSSS